MERMNGNQVDKIWTTMSLELMQSEEGVGMGECKSYLEAIFCRLKVVFTYNISYC